MHGQLAEITVLCRWFVAGVTATRYWSNVITVADAWDIRDHSQKRAGMRFTGIDTAAQPIFVEEEFCGNSTLLT